MLAWTCRDIIDGPVVVRLSADQTDYVGAVEPGTSANEAWWSGWVIEGSFD